MKSGAKFLTLRKACITILLFFIFIIMLINSSSTIAGSKRGLLLWFNDLLPILLPYCIISELLISCNVLSYICRFLRPLFAKTRIINEYVLFVLLLGFTTGIPAGAVTISKLYKSGLLKKNESQFLLACCNNLSPGFIMGMAASVVIGSSYEMSGVRVTVSLLLINTAAAILGAVTASSFSHDAELVSGNTVLPKLPIIPHPSFIAALNTATLDSFEVLVRVAGCIILSTSLSEIIFSKIPQFTFTIYLSGCIEITSGLYRISEFISSFEIRYILVSSLCAFCGISSILQTLGVIAGSGLSGLEFIKAKLNAMFYASILSSAYIIFSV